MSHVAKAFPGQQIMESVARIFLDYSIGLGYNSCAMFVASGKKEPEVGYGRLGELHPTLKPPSAHRRH